MSFISDEKKYRIWRLRGEQELNKDDINGEAESVELQYTKSFPVHDFFNKDTENEFKPYAKKRRLRSPLKPLPTTPQKSTTFALFPCSKSMMSPRKSLKSPKKFILSPKKLFSPTANLPNLVANGKSPHQPYSSTYSSSNNNLINIKVHKSYIRMIFWGSNGHLFVVS